MDIATTFPFFRAVLAKDVAEVRALLEREPLLVHERGHGGQTALHLAVFAGDQDTVAVLLAHGADVDARVSSRPSLTALQVAVLMNRVEIAGTLLDHGANANSPDDLGWRPLHVAAVRGQADMVRVLLAHGAARGVFDGRLITPQDLARRRGQDAVTDLLQPSHAAVHAAVHAADPPAAPDSGAGVDPAEDRVRVGGTVYGSRARKAAR